ncbi:hypothetical protein PIROE2DRAFT_13954 [Piromyces sp. E2]|nr:hypothetical protein PIROE2DRAFT_13954 [Piromyces sp. E2]|eukprot:OUM60301.1 hypothetical protein PIROE2DRAFT_13954 [Piromyces sp. E2]
MIISIYLFLILIHLLSVNCLKSVDCNSIGNEVQCKANAQCQWCNPQWGCMEIKSATTAFTYDCPRACTTDECYTVENINSPIFFNYSKMNAKSKRNIKFTKVKGNRNNPNHFTCSDKCLQAIIAEKNMFTVQIDPSIAQSKTTKVTNKVNVNNNNANNNNANTNNVNTNNNNANNGNVNKNKNNNVNNNNANGNSAGNNNTNNGNANNNTIEKNNVSNNNSNNNNNNNSDSNNSNNDNNRVNVTNTKTVDNSNEPSVNDSKSNNNQNPESENNTPVANADTSATNNEGGNDKTVTITTSGPSSTTINNKGKETNSNTIASTDVVADDKKNKKNYKTIVFILIAALIILLIFLVIVSALLYYQRKSDVLLKVIKNTKKESFQKSTRNIPYSNCPNASSDTTINIDADVNLPSMDTSISNINSSFQNGPPNVSFLNSSNNSFLNDDNLKNSYILPQTTDISVLPLFINDTSVTSKPLDDDPSIPQISCHSINIPKETIDVSNFLLDPSLQHSTFLSGNDSMNLNVKTIGDKTKSNTFNESKNLLSKSDVSPRDSSLYCTTSVDSLTKSTLSSTTAAVYPVETEIPITLGGVDYNSYSKGSRQEGCRKSNSYTHPPRDSSLSAIKGKDDSGDVKVKRYSRSLYNKPPLYHSSNADNEIINNPQMINDRGVNEGDISGQSKEKRVLSDRPTRMSSLASNGSNMSSEQIMSQLINNSILLENYEKCNKLHDEPPKDLEFNEKSGTKVDSFSEKDNSNPSSSTSETVVDDHKDLPTSEISIYQR